MNITELTKELNELTKAIYIHGLVCITDSHSDFRSIVNTVTRLYDTPDINTYFQEKEDEDRIEHIEFRVEYYHDVLQVSTFIIRPNPHDFIYESSDALKDIKELVTVIKLLG